MRKNTGGQVVAAGLVAAADGSAFTGAVTVYVTGDNGAQAVGSVGAGACTHKGNGLHTYSPSQAETNYGHVAYTFVGAGAVPVTVQFYTQPKVVLEDGVQHGGTTATLRLGTSSAFFPAFYVTNDAGDATVFAGNTGGAGYGFRCTGFSAGIRASGTTFGFNCAAAGTGFFSESSTNGHGMHLVGSPAGGHGLQAAGQMGGHGMNLVGSGNGHGLAATGAGTGHGFNGTLSPGALDNITATAPTAVAATFPQKLMQIWERLFGKVVKSDAAGTITVYQGTSSTPQTTQTFTSAGGVDTINRAA